MEDALRIALRVRPVNDEGVRLDDKLETGGIKRCCIHNFVPPIPVFEIFRSVTPVIYQPHSDPATCCLMGRVS